MPGNKQQAENVMGKWNEVNKTVCDYHLLSPLISLPQSNITFVLWFWKSFFHSYLNNVPLNVNVDWIKSIQKGCLWYRRWKLAFESNLTLLPLGGPYLNDLALVSVRIRKCRGSFIPVASCIHSLDEYLLAFIQMIVYCLSMFNSRMLK